MPKDLETLVRWVHDWEDATDEAQNDAELARNYYDGKQWTESEINTIKDRGQPVVTVNLIAKRVNAIVGTQISLRTDPLALPRTPTHEDDANVITDAIRFVADKEDLEQVVTLVTEQLTIEGYAGAVVEIEVTGDVEPIVRETELSEDENAVEVRQVDVGDDNRQVEVKVRPVFWDRLFFDPHSRKKDFSDARYRGVVLWMDKDEALDIYGEEAEDVFDNSFRFGGETTDTLDDRPRDRWVDTRRRRVRIVELYYNKGSHCWVTHFTKAGFMPGREPRPTGFLDERGAHVCPLLMTSAFVDRENNRYGPVKHMISPQDEVNKRRSKALHLVSLRQVVAEENAVKNPFFAQQELAKPDGYIEIRPGMRFEINETSDMAASQFQLLQESKLNIEEIGPSASTLAADDAALSGRAFMVKSEAAQREMKLFFDGIRVWKKELYRHIWMRIRQFWTEERWVRVRDDEERKGFRFVALNRRVSRIDRVNQLVEDDVSLQSALETAGAPPEAMLAAQQTMQAIQMQAQQTGVVINPRSIQPQILATLAQMPEMQEIITENEMAGMDVDIVLSEAPDTAIVEQEEFDKLVQLASSGVVQVPAELIIEAYQGRAKQKMLDILRQPPDDSQRQVQEALVASQIQQGQAFAAQAVADAERKQAQVQETLAKTAKIQAETQLGVPSEAQKDQALAAKHAAEAGEKTGGLI